MQKIQLGKSKVKITKLGMGTWAIGGGPAWGDRDKEESIQTIQRAVAVSYTHLLVLLD